MLRRLSVFGSLLLAACVPQGKGVATSNPASCYTKVPTEAEAMAWRSAQRVNTAESLSRLHQKLSPQLPCSHGHRPAWCRRHQEANRGAKRSEGWRRPSRRQHILLRFPLPRHPCLTPQDRWLACPSFVHESSRCIST